MSKKVVLLGASPPSTVGERDFLGAQFDAGLAFINFPPGYGGLGLSRKLQTLIITRLREAGAPLLAARTPITMKRCPPACATSRWWRSTPC